MPFVNIRIVKEVIAAVIAAAAGVSEDLVWIVFDEIDAKDWFLGKNSVKKLRFDGPWAHTLQ
jgi:4-oxalocrotonate tautomerase